jgi:SSS family transporter
MKALDWLVLAATISAIVGFGLYKTRGIKSVESYLRGGSDVKWTTIGLSIMATQASAITFLSVPGQAYEDGMSFVQFYFGLPLAMVFLSATLVPAYHRLKVYTAYEYLERRFDTKTRLLTAFLFLVQRGLAAGLSIYAPAIILSTVLGWSLGLTNLVIGTLCILYTVSGGTRAVSQTQTHQMIVILSGMAVAFAFIVGQLPPEVSFRDTIDIAGALGKMNLVSFSPRLDTRYSVWSGLSGGLFVALAYFGTDQSQVQRYLSGGSLTESRLGLLFNGLVKVPMQAGILFVGLMVFVFHQFHPPPLFFNEAELARAKAAGAAAELAPLEERWQQTYADKKLAIEALTGAPRGTPARDAAAERLRALDATSRAIRDQAKQVIKKADPAAELKDSDYIFIRFVTTYFPSGLVGLLLAVILCAAMSATASALNALGSTTVVDFYRRLRKKEADDAHDLRAAKLFTVLWGILALSFAAFAALIENLIQAVNILGSIFYGPTLGVFLIGFFSKRIQGSAVFVALIIAQLLVIATFAFSEIGFLWYNVIGCAGVLVLSWGFQRARGEPTSG